MARQWFVEGVQVCEDGAESASFDGVQLAEDQPRALPDVAKVQSKSGVGSGATPLVLTLDSPTTAGNLLVVSLGWRQGAAGGITFSIADNKGNTFSVATPPYNTTAFNRQASIQYAPVTSGGASHQVTVTISASITAWQVIVTEFSGIEAVTPFDQQGSSAAASTSQTTPLTTALAQADELVYGAFYLTETAPTITEGVGFTRDVQIAQLTTEYKAVSSAAPARANWTTSTSINGAVAVATFRASTVVAPGTYTATATLTSGAATLAGVALGPPVTIAPTLATYTNFCCRLGGNNLNAGSVDGSATEPSVTPLVTYTGGDWDATTDIYTAPVGADMTQAVVGRFAALCHDGDVTPTTNQFFIAYILAVNAGTRQITLDYYYRTTLGTEVATGTANRTLRIGGAWLGPSGATPWLNVFPGELLQNPDLYPPRVRTNLKNDQIYDITAVVTLPGSYAQFIQGYTSSYGDGGRTVIRGPATGTAFNLLSVTGSGVSVIDLEFTRNGDSLSSIAAVSTTANLSGTLFRRCVAHDVNGAGFEAGANTEMQCIECEAYNCNQSLSLVKGGFTFGARGGQLIRCISHHNSGAFTDGFLLTNGAAVNCVADSNGRFGFHIASTAYPATLLNCDARANAKSGVFVNTNGVVRLHNCNLLANSEYGVDTSVVTAGAVAFIANCGFGTGSVANTLGPVNGNVAVNGPISYPSGVTPWLDPGSGNFSLSLPAAVDTGRGAFLQTAPGYGGTTGYPNVGATTLGGNAYTASAALVTGKATLTGTATFTKPTYRVTTAPLTASKATLAGTATFTQPTYRVTTAPLTSSKATLAGVATFRPTRTAAVPLTAGKATLAGTATFVQPTYRVTTAPLTSSKATLAATATFVKPTYRVTTAPLTTSKATLTSTATFVRPPHTATAPLVTSKPTLAATVTFIAPAITYAVLNTSRVTLAGTATFVKPTYRVTTAPLTSGKATLTGTALFAPRRIATAALATSKATLATTVTFTKPTYRVTTAPFTSSKATLAGTATFAPRRIATSTLTASKATLTATVTFTKPTYRVTTAPLTSSKATLAGAATFKPGRFATGALTSSKAALSGAATFVKPTYRVTTAPLTASKATLAGTATYRVGRFATSALTSSKATLAGSATFVKPTYRVLAAPLVTSKAILAAATSFIAPAITYAVVNTSRATLTGNATFVKPTYRVTTAPFIAGKVTLVGTAMSAPRRTAAAPLTASKVTLVAVVMSAKPTYRVTTAPLTTSKTTLTGAATFRVGRYATAGLITGKTTLISVGTVAKPQYTATANLTTRTTLVGGASFTKPVRTATAALPVGHTILVSAATFTRPVYTGTANLTVRPRFAGTAVFTKPGITATMVVWAGPATLEGAATFFPKVEAAAPNLLIGPTTLEAAGKFGEGGLPKGIFSYPAFLSLFAD